MITETVWNEMMWNNVIIFGSLLVFFVFIGLVQRLKE